MTTPHGTPGGEPNAPRPVVIIADADPDIRRLVEVVVPPPRAGVGAPVAVWVVAEGAQAWQAFIGVHPAVAILDVAMPEQSGLDVCRLVRADASLSDIKLILLSAAVHPEAIEAGRAAGADLYNQKPFGLRQLQDAIRGLLSTAVETS